MMQRRTFLGLGGVALVGTACRPTATVSDAGDLPGPIAALQPMTDSARPIEVDERHVRIEKARRLMGEHEIDALMLTGGTSMDYFTGVGWGLSERLFSMVIPAAGTAFVVTPAFEEDRTREQLQGGPVADAEVLTWEEDEDPGRLLVQGLASRGARTGQLGIEETVRFVFSNAVSRSAPALDLVPATPVTAGCRAIKDAHELELMRLANAITLRAFEAVYRSLEEGMTRDQVGDLIRQAHQRLGTRGGALVLVGEYTALPHGTTLPQTLREGDMVLIDGGCKVEGYGSDISRTFVLGKPTARMKDVFALELEAQTAALRAARPGVPCEAVDAAAREVIVAGGFGPDYRYFTHRVGHGIGMDGHEWPYLVRGNRLPLEPGMTFSDEPGIYLPGEFGVRLEDDMFITSEGAELFTPQSPSLEEPFAVA